MFATLAMLVTGSANAQSFYWYVGQENPVGIDTDNLKAATNEAGWHLIGESIDGFTLTFNNDNLIEFEEDKPYYLIIPEELDALAADGNTLLEYKTFFPVDCNIANHKAYVYYTSVWEVKGLVLKSGVTKYYWYVGQEDPANNQTVTYTTGEEGWRLIQQPSSVTKNNPLFDTIDSDEETIVGTKAANWYIAFPVDKSYRIFDSDHEDQITAGNFYVYSYVTFNDVEYVVYKGFGTARKWRGYTIYGGEVAQYYYWYAGQEHPSQVSTIVTDKSSTGWRMTGSSLTSHYGFNTTVNPIASNPSQNARWYFALPANTGLGMFDAIHNDYAIDENTADKWTEYAGTCTFQGVEYIVYCTGESRSFNAHYVRPKDFVPELTLNGVQYAADAASLTASVEGVEEGFSQVDVEIPAKVDYCYSTVTNINTHAFSNNTVISSILLPSTITRIARLAFVRCSNLTSITLLGQTPPEVDVEAFSDFHYEQITLNVPEGAEEAYKQHEVWGKFFKEEEPEPEGLIAGKNYRVKNVTTGLYLQVEGNNTNMKLQNKAEGLAMMQIFGLEDAEEGKYYIKAADADNRYYAHASGWNFNATTNADNKTPFTIALVEGEEGVYTLHQSVSAYPGLAGADDSAAGAAIYCNKGVDNNGKWAFEALTAEEQTAYVATLTAAVKSALEATIAHAEGVVVNRSAVLSADEVAAINAAVAAAKAEKDNTADVSVLYALTDAINAAVSEAIYVWSLDELSNEVCYAVSTEDRGAWYSQSENLTGTTKAGIAADATDSKQQFAFVKSATTGVCYLYSVSEEKFVSAANDKTALTEAPVQTITFLEGTRSAKYPWVVALNAEDGQKQMGISNGYDPAIITFYNDLGDGGNTVRIEKVAAFDATAALAAIDALETNVGQLTVDKSQLTIYDLTGRRVEKAEKGIYIVNGRKVIVK